MKRLAFAFVLVACASGLSAAKELPDFTALVEQQGPAVVNVSTIQAVQRPRQHPPIPGMPEKEFHDFFRRFVPPGGVPGAFESKSRGSGFIISSDGYILTNAHVLQDAEEIIVGLTGGHEYKARVVGSDGKTDVALLKVDAHGLPKVKIGDPRRLKVGEWVAAIGSPFGFENSVTAGIVSAKGRLLPQEDYVPFIQTDVAINPGNSGGPLFNLKGEVVGINSQIYSRTGGSMGLSFAIPIDVAMEVAQQLRVHGKVTRGWLGIMVQEINDELAGAFGLDKPGGALITAVQKDGPADKGGLRPSDVVLAFNGKKVSDSSELPRLIDATKPGTRVALQVWRNQGVREVGVVVGELPGDKPVPVRTPAKNANKVGLVLSELTPEQEQQYGVTAGLLVQEAQGAAALAGVRRGDIILALGRQATSGVEQFNQLISEHEAGRSVPMLLRRGNNVLYVALGLDGK